MKHLLVLAMLMFSYAAIAGDKPIAAKDLPVVPTKLTIEGEVSTVNETTKPVILLKPESAIDDAISAPSKNIAADKVGEYSTASTSAEKKVIVQKKPTYVLKKPEQSRKKPIRKKRRLHTKYKKQEAAEKDAVSAVDESMGK